MTQLLLKRAHDVAPTVAEKSTALVIAAHGTDLNENSAVAAKREAEKIRKLDRYAAVLNLYMEEPPLISDWMKLTNTENVVVVPFFISDGLHSYEDIPVLLGIALERAGANPGAAARREVFRQNPYQIDNRAVYYAGAIGTEPEFTDTIIKQVARFDCGSEGSVPEFLIRRCKRQRSSNCRTWERLCWQAAVPRNK